MRNVTGQAVIGDDLYGRENEINRVWERLEQGEHILMVAPRRVGKTSLMLSLRNAPRKDWDVFYIDVQGGEGPADCVAAILASLAASPRYRRQLEAVPFQQALRDALRRLSATVETDLLRVELKSALGGEWRVVADRLRARLIGLSGTRRILIIVDEFPILISRMLRTKGQDGDAEQLLSWFRELRHAPELRDRVCTLIGGSIGLEGVLRRHGLPGLINDLSPFRLDSWSRPTASAFLEELGSTSDFSLAESSATRMLDLLGDPVPYHVQLFFRALKDSFRSDAKRVSPEGIECCFRERLAGASGTVRLDHYAIRLKTALDEREHEMAIDILCCACRRKSGATLAELDEAIRRDEQVFRSVLRDLEADGYLTRENEQWMFRSNLLREWWRRWYGRKSPR